ncbi:MAG: hypothetical protein M3Q03_07120 [Chloroflexota bacterium]|nr:hypothetical protein [Chloroflexota bacterium]
MPSSIRLCIPVILFVVLLAWPIAASAQRIDTPSPEECRVGRRSLAALERLAATPSPVRASPTPEGAKFVPPPGEPISPGAIAAITATQRGALACANAGDRIRGMSLYSPDFIRRILADAAASGLSVERIYDLFTPGGWVRPSDYVGILAVRDARLLPDGRIGAFFDVVTGNDPSVVETDFVFFVEVRGGWLIDDFVVVDIQFSDDLATPGR